MIRQNIIKETINHVLKTFLIILVAVPVISITTAGNVEASTGQIIIDNKTNLGFTRNMYSFCHIRDFPVTEGYDPGLDYLYGVAPPFHGVDFTSKIFSVAGGKELDIDARPENSLKSVDIYFSFISDSNNPMTFSSNELNILLRVINDPLPFQNEDVFLTINGNTYDLKTTSTIPMPTGTFNSDEVYVTGTLSFTPIPVQLTDPEVSTLSASSIGQREATFNANFISDGNEAGTDLCMGRFGYFAQGDEGNLVYTDWINNLSEGNTFSYSVSGLEPNSSHGVWAEISAPGDRFGLGGLEYFVTLATPTEPILKDKLLIKNFLSQFMDPADPNKPVNASTAQGILEYLERAGALATFDPNDVLHRITPGWILKSSKVVSLLPIKNSKGKVFEFYELSTDARPVIEDANDPNNSKLIELSVYGADPNLVVSSANELIFSLPHYDVNNMNLAFGGKPLTIQRIADANELTRDPNFAHPVVDIRQVIGVNKGKLPLDYLVTLNADPNTFPADSNSIKIIKPNQGYAFFDLSTNRDVMDLDRNKIVDANDYYHKLLNEMGKTGPSRSDIASIINNKIVLGIPSGDVNEVDARAFVEKFNQMHPDIPILREGFESGNFQTLNWNPAAYNTTAPWTVASSGAYEGKNCAQAINNMSAGNSYLETTVNCPEDGYITAWMKLKSDSIPASPALSFYTDGRFNYAARFSGNEDWQEVKIPVNKGTHTFGAFYKQTKTVFSDEGAWIDNVEFKPGYIGAN